MVAEDAVTNMISFVLRPVCLERYFVASVFSVIESEISNLSPVVFKCFRLLGGCHLLRSKNQPAILALVPSFHDVASVFLKGARPTGYLSIGRRVI